MMAPQHSVGSKTITSSRKKLGQTSLSSLGLWRWWSFDSPDEIQQNGALYIKRKSTCSTPIIWSGSGSTTLWHIPSHFLALLSRWWFSELPVKGGICDRSWNCQFLILPPGSYILFQDTSIWFSRMWPPEGDSIVLRLLMRWSKPGDCGLVGRGSLDGKFEGLAL